MAKVCRNLNITELELARLCAIPWTQWRRWVEQDSFPSYVCLHFKQLESWFFELSTKQPQPPLMPVHLLAK